MASRYWVPGGSGVWGDSTITTNWAATSGGTRNASVPIAGDDVFFDNNSGNPTVLVQTAVVLRDFNITGPCTLTLGQNLSLSSVSGTLTITAGSFDTSTFNFAAAGIVSSGTLSRTLTLNSGTHTLSGASSFVTSGTGFTFNAGTSSIVLTSASATLSTQGLTFYNVSLTNTVIATATISGVNTFNNLSIAGLGSTGLNRVNFGADQTINGTLTLSAGATSIARTIYKSDIIGTTRTLTVNSFAATNDLDFRDITIAGTAAPINASALRFGDCKGNSGITFPAAKTVFYRATGAGSWGSTTGWSATSGGTASAASFPLAQDTASFPAATYPSSGSTTTINAGYNIGTIDMSLRTSNTMTLATGTQVPNIYGDLITGTGITYTGTGTGVIVFTGRTTQNITSANKIFPRPISIESPGGTVVLQDAFNSSNAADSSLVSGTLNLNGYATNLSGYFNTIGTNTRSIIFAGATLSLGASKSSAGSVWNATSTGLTLDGTGTIELLGGGVSARTFAGGGNQSYSNLFFSASTAFSGLTITGSNKFNDISNGINNSGSPTGLLFQGGTTNEFTSFNVNGSVFANLPLRSTNTTQASLKKPSVWSFGTGSVDAGNNTGFTTGGSSGNYLTVSYINGIAGGETYLVSVEETATSTDTLLSSVNFLASVVESATVSDGVTVILSLNAATAETVTASDIVATLISMTASVVEQTTVDVVLVAPSSFVAIVTEVATALDSFDYGISYNVQFVDSATVTDDIRGGFTYIHDISESVSTQEILAVNTLFSTVISEALISSDRFSSIFIGFNYEAIKDLYSRNRTVYVSRTSLPSDRTVLVSAMDRTVYVSRTSLPSDRIALAS